MKYVAAAAIAKPKAVLNEWSPTHFKNLTSKLRLIGWDSFIVSTPSRQFSASNFKSLFSPLDLTKVGEVDEQFFAFMSLFPSTSNIAIIFSPYSCR